MTREKAMEILLNDGWNEDGAIAIIDELNLEDLTEEELLETSEDYKDR